MSEVKNYNRNDVSGLHKVFGDIKVVVYTFNYFQKSSYNYLLITLEAVITSS